MRKERKGGERGGEDNASVESRSSLQNLRGLHRHRLIEQHRQQPRNGEWTLILISLHHRHIVAGQMGLVFLPKTYSLSL